MASIGQTITLEATHAILGTAASQNVLDLVEAIHKNQPADGLNVLQAAMDAGTDTRMLARQVVEYLRALLLIKLGNTEQANLPKETLKQAKVHAAAFTSPQILHMVREFNAVAADTRGSWQPSLGLELALAGVMLEPSREKAPSILFQSASVTNTEPAQPKIDPAQSKPLQAQFKPPSESGKTVSTPDKPLQEKKAEVPAKQVVIPSEKPDTQVVKETGSEMARMAKEWKNISAALKSNRTLNALMNSCRPMEVRNGVLTLGFASDILRDKANTPEQLEIIHNTISELLGLDLQVKCAISGARQDAPTDIKQDGMVAAAIKAGGKITDIQD
jgi:DNA polymerase-3 subunit gamma/tau